MMCMLLLIKIIINAIIINTNNNNNNQTFFLLLLFFFIHFLLLSATIFLVDSTPTVRSGLRRTYKTLTYENYEEHFGKINLIVTGSNQSHPKRAIALQCKLHRPYGMLSAYKATMLTEFCMNQHLACTTCLLLTMFRWTNLRAMQLTVCNY